MTSLKEEAARIILESAKKREKKITKSIPHEDIGDPDAKVLACEEQLNELSKKTLGRYKVKAKNDALHSFARGDIEKAKKRLDGIDKANLHKEEEQLDELSRDTLSSYTNKASKSLDKLEKNMERVNDKGYRSKRRAKEKMITKHFGRLEGIIGAKKRMDEGELNETLPPHASAPTIIHDFVHSKNKVFKGDSKKERIRRALGAYYHRKREGK